MAQRLHHHPLFPLAARPTAAWLRGEPVERVDIALGTGALRRPEFVALSPMGKLPVLETDEGPIYESTSIIEYWEDRGPRVLLPHGLERSARHFDRVGDLYLMAPVSALWWEPGTPAADEAPDTVARAWGILDRQLADGRAFLVGDRFTLADLGAAIASDYLVLVDQPAPPGVAAWLHRCFALDAMAASLAEALPWVERLHPRARAAAADS